MCANLNLDLYRKAYFYFDLPVEYKIKDKTLLIYPVTVKDSEIFLSSMSVIGIDKNSVDSVEIIQMSYLDFIYKVLFQEQINISKFLNILKYCLRLENEAVEVGYDVNNKPFLRDKDNEIEIKSKDFENIRRIILYQNLIHYDDEYINPEAKKAMNELDALRNANIELPSIERKMAIITAHCGISKQEQMNMTYRSHSLLFEEVYGEVEFETTRPILLYAGKGNEMDHWIYKKKKGKFDGYFQSVKQYTEKMGGDSAIKISQDSAQSIGESYNKQFTSFRNN